MKPREMKEGEFFGKITAGVTHEIRNVMAIIGENSGLMEDILAMTSEKDFPKRERFLKAVANIRAQLSRGTELATRLNNFSHNPDEPVTEARVGDLVEQLMLLCERFARQKGIELRSEVDDRDLRVKTNVLHLQMALFSLFEAFWSVMPQGAALVVRGTKTGDGAAVELFCRENGSFSRVPERVDLDALQASMKGLLASLEAALDRENADGPVILSLPNQGSP